MRLFRQCVCVGLFAVAVLAASVTDSDLKADRDRQDLAALDAAINQLRSQPDYHLALAYSYASELAMELRDKRKSESYAEAGLDVARKLVDTHPENAEDHRLLGELCGQVIPANPLLGALKYGQCAHDEIAKAIQIDPKLALAYVSQGVGNYYLPASMGGGTDIALQNFDKAISLDPRLSEAYLWKGITLRKAGRNADARQALQKAVELDPARMWAKKELDKTPAH